MTPELLSGFVAAVISFLMSMAPGFNTWFDALDGVYKRLFTAGMIIVVGAAVAGIACAGFAGYFDITVACDENGLVTLAKTVGTALLGSQGMYMLVGSRGK
jgi:hypothetical protein